jgi:hypothetical protein
MRNKGAPVGMERASMAVFMRRNELIANPQYDANMQLVRKNPLMPEERESDLETNVMPGRQTMAAIVIRKTDFFKPQYDANMQIIRKSQFVSAEDCFRESENILSAMQQQEGGDFGDQQPGGVTVIVEEDESPTVLTKKIDSWTLPQKIALQCVTISCFIILTWALAFRGPKLGAVFAAVTTATVASMLIPDMIIYASIGCYAGMTNVKAPPLLTICILTSIAGVCFNISVCSLAKEVDLEYVHF